MKAKFLALAALVLGLASCQTDPEVVGPVAGNGEVDFQLSVAAPELTRAGKNGAADEQNAWDSAFGAIDYLQATDAADEYRIDWTEVDLRYTLEVYDVAGDYADATPVKDRQVIIVDKYEPVAFDLRLVPNRDYHFVVFADFVMTEDATDNPAIDAQRNIGARHIIGDNLGQITIKNENDAINDEIADAYFATKDINISNSAAQDIVLKRPYGKLRVVATDLAELNINVDPGSVEVVYTAKHPTQFNAVTGDIVSEVAEGKATYASEYNNIFKGIKEGGLQKHFYTAGYDNYELYGTKNANNVERHTHMTLFTDYIFGEQQENAQTPYHFTLNVYDKGGDLIKSTDFNTDIPVERNKLTTVVGNVLTTATEIEVRIDDNFAGEIVEKLWTGDVKAPAYDEASKTYTITEESELAWLAAAVNGTLEDTRAAVPAKTFKGETFKLTKDLDLNGEPWTPIGVNGSFEGTFDGDNHVIYNLFVDNGRTSNAGLFGTTQNGEIKNLVVENANIKGRLNVAVIAGNPYTSKYTNITVRGHVEVNGMAYVGGVGGKNAYANWENITVNVDETSYVNANSVENGTAYRTYVGGVVGFNGEGGHSFKNITSNIDVKGSTCDVGGLFGIAHYGNQFEDCSCSGDVEIYAAEEAEEAEEIGGIAGVWHNQNGTTVTMTNVEFRGNVTTNIARGNVWYNNLVGKPYSDTGTGKFILDGYEMIANGVGVNDEGEYLVTATEGLEYIAEQVNAGIKEFTDADIVLNGDIDLAQLAAMTRSNAPANNWTPIGTEANPFTGTFDGNGKTIKNLALVENEAKEGKVHTGFIGYAEDAIIKNVTFENVYINIPCLDIDHSQGHIGAVVGTIEGTSLIEDVTVKGDIKIEATPSANGASRVAVVAGGNSYADVTIKNVHVIANDGSYLKANNNTGAIAGQLQGKTLYENCSSNIDVTVNKFYAGGIVGLAGTNDKFINCHTTGNISVVAGREGRHNDEYRVGGIAGGWADGKNNVLTLENCSYTGKISGKNSDGAVAETLDYFGYVGRGYTLNNCEGSKVIIDGTEFVQVGNAAPFGVYTINGCTPVATAEELVAALAAGKGVYLLNDITVAATKGGYNKAGILQNKAQTIDGGGHTLKVTGAGATWECAIYTHGGIIRNLTVAGAMRGIFTAGQSSDLHIENVVFKNVIYTFNSDGKMPANPYGVYVSNSTVNGWTSHSNMHTEVVYTDCSFGEGSGYAYCRPYGKTAFVNCTFNAGYSIDKTQTTEITFTNCTWK